MCRTLNLLDKTSRRLTSDPIRISLGLLPSGPDPIGEWLVHRQSPGAYLGPKWSESKRGACRKSAASFAQESRKKTHYPWLMLVPRRADTTEIIDLDEVAQGQLMTEINRVGRALKEITKCDKLNVAALGNMVPQLHVHIIARRKTDAAWPRPIWGVMPPLAHDAAEVQRFISELRRKIWLG
jgi:diadenosine tetraphosphate (Ap4A) HIT family hydrolase